MDGSLDIWDKQFSASASVLWIIIAQASMATDTHLFIMKFLYKEILRACLLGDKIISSSVTEAHRWTGTLGRTGFNGWDLWFWALVSNLDLHPRGTVSLSSLLLLPSLNGAGAKIDRQLPWGLIVGWTSVLWKWLLSGQHGATAKSCFTYWKLHKQLEKVYA